MPSTCANGCGRVERGGIRQTSPSGDTLTYRVPSRAIAIPSGFCPFDSSNATTTWTVACAAAAPAVTKTTAAATTSAAMLRPVRERGTNMRPPFGPDGMNRSHDPTKGPDLGQGIPTVRDTGDVDPLEAFTAFEGRLLQRLSTRVVPFAWGTAYLNDDLPQRFYSNFLRTETDLTGVSANDLIGAADEILGDDRFEHRLVIVRDEAAAERLGPGFAASGFARAPEAIQMLRREPDRPPAVDVDVVPFAEARGLILQTYLED